MTRRARFVPALALMVAVAGCEKHTAPATSGAPEYLHEALSGDLAAELSLARCYDKGAEGVGCSPDPALACAWRGVRLASRSPELALADNTDFATACATGDPTERQRAAIALGDLVWRVHGRDLPDLPQLTDTLAKAPVLYPAVETVRAKVNGELARIGRPERLPAAGRGPAKEGEPVTWTSCSGPICLDAATPSFGGGVLAYRVTVAAAAGSPQGLAARLAAAGLDAPSALDILTSAAPRGVVKDGVCWSAGSADRGAAFAGASLAPCGAAPTFTH